MERRTFLKKLLAATAGLSLAGLQRKAATAQAAPHRNILLQESPVAGFQFHQGEAIWPMLQAGDRLRLVAEPENPYDRRAVKVLWQDYQLGYVPRRENLAISTMLARGETLTATISRLQLSNDPWQRVRLQIFLVRNGGS